MSRTIDFAVLTKSAKHHELCIAGIDWNTGEFIRIVTLDEKTDGAVPKDKFHYVTGNEVACFDLIKISVSTHDGNELQPENLIWDQSQNIEFIKKVNLHDVLTKHPAEKQDFIFGDTYSYTNLQTLEKTKKSLILAEVENFQIYLVDVTYKDEITGELKTITKTKARFSYNGKYYENISVTDPKYFLTEATYDNAYIIVSSGNEYKGCYYKWIAAIYDNIFSNTENPFTIDEHILESLNLNQNNMLNELATKSIDTSEIKKIAMDDNSKIDNISFLCQKIKDEINKLTEQKRALTQNSEILRDFLSDTLAGKTYHSKMVNITYRDNDSVKFNKEFIDQIPKNFLSIDKNEVRKALKQGQSIPGCELMTKQSLLIKIKE